MKFEYGINKSASNKEKHGIDFEEVKALWSDENLLVIPLCFEDEMRYAYIGKIQRKVWTAITTWRGKTIRIISVRRAHKDEEKAYESE